MTKLADPAITKHVSLNLNVRGLRRSATLANNERCKELQRQGHKIYRMGLGQSPFPVPRAVVNTLKHFASEKDYLPVAGLSDLRQAVARFHRDKDQVEVHPDSVLVGPGSKELMFLLQLVFYGDIMLPSPCWVSYGPQAKILGRKVQIIHTTYEEKWRVTPRLLEEHCEADNDTFRPRLLLLNYPGNPEGGGYFPDELQALADVARQYELIVLSDEIYGQLNFAGTHVSMARFYPERTIISSGLSKWCGAGGWRLGTFAFPDELRWLLEAMASVASETYTSVSAPIQYAAVRAFNGDLEIERYLWHARRILASLGYSCYEQLSRAGIRVHAPQGGFYLFLDFGEFSDRLARRGIRDSSTLCERLLEDVGVAILPGSAFERPRYELTARMAYVNFDGAKALSASERTPLDQSLPESFICEWCPEVVEATQKILEWLDDAK